MDIKIVAIFCLTALLITCFFLFSRVLNRSIDSAGSAFEAALVKRIFENGAAVRLLTVTLVVICATYLELGATLTDGAAALLAGVAGYVLGGIGKEDTSTPSTDTHETLPIVDGGRKL